jgi:2,3-bisphosphoglycerate-independent phosphoglycerate mutase
MEHQKAFLFILDGWGFGPKPQSDAIQQARTPFMDELLSRYPNATLITHGEQVGLPDGQMGNSEVGHLNIGAGRIVYQELARINKALREGELAQNPVLREALEYAREQDKPIHLFGLVSDGGVHSHYHHLMGLCDIISDFGGVKAYIHAFTDGRDCDPKSGAGFLQEVLDHIAEQPVELASIIGRYYSMDRDKRWERIKLAYDLMVRGEGEHTTDPIETIRQRYRSGETDEFLKPILCTEDDRPLAKIEEGDVLLSFNFRTDRPREISEVLTQKDHPEYDMQALKTYFVTMTRYDDTFEKVHVIFEKEDIRNTMGEILSRAGKTQVRIAETEKYPHVTFFFSGGREKEFPGESRILIPSPKVATYDLQPEMSAPKVKDAIIEEIRAKQPDFICLNFANTDMVGHTGVFEAAVKAAETVDQCMQEIIPVALEHDYECIIIADHGNSDFMINEDGSPNTAHTKNPVPIIYVSPKTETARIRSGKLGDIAPTLLFLMGQPIPEEMTGDILVSRT